MIIIGEKINGTRTAVAQAIQARDEGFIENLALQQTSAGAHYLDVNAGTGTDRETNDMLWLVRTIQEVTEVPLCLDSANPKTLESGIGVVKRTPMLNSLSGEKKRLDMVLPLVCEYKTELIVLALDDGGIPKTSEDRLTIIRRLIEKTREGGLPDENLYVDPLVTAIATGTENAKIAFETIRRIKVEFPQVHIIAGVSNISFGMPSRSHINQAFAVLAIAAGLDSAIINPEDRGLLTMIYAAELLMGMDRHCLNYNQAYRAGIIGTPRRLKQAKAKQ